MCISWYDLTLSCSVPPTSTRCHSGRSTVPVYNQEANISLMCVVLYTVHSTCFSICLGIYLFIMTIGPLCLYKVSESIYILHTILLWVLMCEGYCNSTLAASVFTPSTNGVVSVHKLVKKTILMAPICVYIMCVCWFP